MKTSDRKIDQAADNNPGDPTGGDTGTAGDRMSDPRRPGQSGEAPAGNRPGWAARRLRLSRHERERLAGERARLRVEQYRRLEALRRVWEEIGLVADRNGWPGVVKLAEESEDRLSDGLRALEKSCREVDRLGDDTPEAQAWLAGHRQRVQTMDDVAGDPLDDAGDGPGDDLRRPDDLVQAMGLLRPGVAADMRVW